MVPWRVVENRGVVDVSSFAWSLYILGVETTSSTGQSNSSSACGFRSPKDRCYESVQAFSLVVVVVVVAAGGLRPA